MSQRHEGLVAWQRADDLCVRIYRLTQARFPRDEKYGLSAQLRRAVYSVAANIVEGYADDSNKWRLRYLRIAIASLAEVGYGVHLAQRLDYLTPTEYSEIEKQISGTAAPLHGLATSLKATLRKR